MLLLKNWPGKGSVNVSKVIIIKEITTVAVGTTPPALAKYCEKPEKMTAWVTQITVVEPKD